MMTKKRVLFYQHFGHEKVIRGAHHKTYDFFQHVSANKKFIPIVVFDSESQWHDGLPWYQHFSNMPTLDSLTIKPDIFFLNSGKDWLRISQHIDIPSSTPIISPVNHFKAVNPKHPAYELLSKKAIRICPSPELYQAVKNHPNTNGPCLYVPNGVYVMQELKSINIVKDIDLLIVGQKNPDMATELMNHLSQLDLKIDCIDYWIDRNEFQNKIAKSKISIHLPKKIEAHYIPAIESMMLNSLVIMPNCIGNETYAKHKKNCIITQYDIESIYNCLKNTLELPSEDLERIITQARRDAQFFNVEREKMRINQALEIAINEW